MMVKPLPGSVGKETTAKAVVFIWRCPLRVEDLVAALGTLAGEAMPAGGGSITPEPGSSLDT